MLSDTRFKKRLIVLQFCMIALMFISLLPIIFKPYIWYDETFTINLIRKPVAELVRITALDVHPPLYYLIVKLSASLFGDHMWAYHLPSLLSYIVLLILTVLFFSKYFNAYVSLLVTAALCSMPNMIKYALELRMYSMSMLLILSGMYVSYLIIINSTENIRLNLKCLKLWFLLAFIHVAAAYTHYFAGVAAAGISLFLLLFLIFKYKKRCKTHLFCWGIYCITMFLLYLPWLPTLLSQMSSVARDYWILPLTETALHETPQIIFQMPSDFLQQLVKVFFLLGLFLFISHLSKSRESFWLSGCFFVVIFWFLFLVLYSVIKSPVLVDRYLLILLPLIWIPVVCGYAFTDNAHIAPLLFILFTACFIQNYEERYNAYAFSSDIRLCDFGTLNIAEEDVFFHFYYQDLSMANAYFPENEHYIFQNALNGQAALAELADYKEIQSLDQLMSVPGNIWCLNNDYVDSFTEAGFQAEFFALDGLKIIRIYRDEQQEILVK